MFLLRDEATTIAQVTKNITGEQQGTITTKLFQIVEYIRDEGLNSAFYHYVMILSPCSLTCVQAFHAKERSSDMYKKTQRLSTNIFIRVQYIVTYTTYPFSYSSQHRPSLPVIPSH